MRVSTGEERNLAWGGATPPPPLYTLVRLSRTLTFGESVQLPGPRRSEAPDRSPIGARRVAARRRRSRGDPSCRTAPLRQDEPPGRPRGVDARGGPSRGARGPLEGRNGLRRGGTLRRGVQRTAGRPAPQRAPLDGTPRNDRKT